MSEFEPDVEKRELETGQSLVPVENEANRVTDDEFLGDLKMQAREFGQNIQDAAARARDFANEKFAYAGEKLKEFQGKDPKELIDDAKEFTRQNPGQAILITAAVGFVLGWLLKRR